MSESMQQQIDLEVNKMRAPGGIAGVMFSRHEYEQIIRKAITNGTLIGYIHGETFTRERLDAQVPGHGPGDAALAREGQRP